MLGLSITTRNFSRQHNADWIFYFMFNCRQGRGLSNIPLMGRRPPPGHSNLPRQVLSKLLTLLWLFWTPI